MANYIEFVLLPDNCDHGEFVSFDMPEPRFVQLLEKMSGKNIKCYERKLKTYIKDSLFYEVILDQMDVINDLRSYSKNVVDCFVKDNILQVSYEKLKKPIHTFSSSCDMQDVVYTQRLTYRISNRVFINFEVSKSISKNNTFRKVFINANTDTNVDMDYIMSEVNMWLKNML
jgi:hypothetical protein